MATNYLKKKKMFAIMKDIFDIDFKKATELSQKSVKTCFKNGDFEAYTEDVRPIPESDLWFEKVWNEYMEKRMVKIR